jgi:hypothetical protein
LKKERTTKIQFKGNNIFNDEEIRYVEEFEGKKEKNTERTTRI